MSSSCLNESTISLPTLAAINKAVGSNCGNDEGLSGAICDYTTQIKEKFNQRTDHCLVRCTSPKSENHYF